MEIGDDDEPKPKIRKTVDGSGNTKGCRDGGGECSDQDSIFMKFFADDTLYTRFMKHFEGLLRKPKKGFLSSVIQSCDAASSAYRNGKSFTQCECIAIKDCTDLYHFGAFFDAGVNICNYLLKKKIPQDPHLKQAARRLLTYILEEKEWHEELNKLRDNEHIESEAQVMATLAEHFFKRLCLAQGYKQDNHTRKDNCCMKLSTKDLKYADTSVGNKKVWHGNMDLIFNSGEVVVNIAPEVEDVDDDEDDDYDVDDDYDRSSVGHSQIELKKLDKLNSLQSRSRILAQTIVWSFSQKQRHPESKHFLVPCIIANDSQFKVFFYDAQHDILLESRRFKFTYRNSIRYDSVIAAWLVLNHKLLCSGIYPECLASAPKSNFRKFVGDSISIYENDLSFKNVKPSALKFKASDSDSDDWEILSDECTFQWPESRPEVGPIKET